MWLAEAPTTTSVPTVATTGTDTLATAAAAAAAAAARHNSAADRRDEYADGGGGGGGGGGGIGEGDATVQRANISTLSRSEEGVDPAMG